MDLDPADLKLLAALQRDSSLTAQDLGTALNMSPSQAGRRRVRNRRRPGIAALQEFDPVRDTVAVRVAGAVVDPGHAGEHPRRYDDNDHARFGGRIDHQGAG